MTSRLYELAKHTLVGAASMWVVDPLVTMVDSKKHLSVKKKAQLKGICYGLAAGGNGLHYIVEQIANHDRELSLYERFKAVGSGMVLGGVTGLGVGSYYGDILQEEENSKNDSKNKTEV
ncbi:hypothetical protein JW711_00035 [Candidatus Woesearchaeota archaeon]|nr:hypothetical protein [Candidatus Woesearchaeota archaeon]